MFLTVVLFVCFAVAGTLVKLARGAVRPGAQAGAAAARLCLVCFLTAAVLGVHHPPLALAGWKLPHRLLVYYGRRDVMGQIESAVFITQLPPGTLPRLFLMGR